MWPFIKKRFYVVLLCNPQYLICCAFIQHLEKFSLLAYEHTALTCLELENNIIFNPTRISNLINRFLINHTITKPFITVSLSGPAIIEQLVTVNTASPSVAQLYDQSKRDINWNYEYLYPKNNQFTFYVCGIPHHIIFQYQLLALKNHYNMIQLTTDAMASLAAYKYHAGNNFRQAQLALDMQSHHNILAALIAPDMLKTLVDIPSTISITHTDATHLLLAYGLMRGTL